jgi:hypothetical protein
VARHRRYGDSRRDADENQQRRHQESAANAEHAGNEADRESHCQQQEEVDRQVRNRKIDVHGINPTTVRSAPD